MIWDTLEVLESKSKDVTWAIMFKYIPEKNYDLSFSNQTFTKEQPLSMTAKNLILLLLSFNRWK